MIYVYKRLNYSLHCCIFIIYLYIFINGISAFFDALPGALEKERLLIAVRYSAPCCSSFIVIFDAALSAAPLCFWFRFLRLIAIDTEDHAVGGIFPAHLIVICPNDLSHDRQP